mmetsp:Transcript_23588/g.70858  ORF Transcript_23588/g.70858 Transcript_23588/m.70858 type:complete len:288 (-) Transcript_23588:24-887(-)
MFRSARGSCHKLRLTMSWMILVRVGASRARPGLSIRRTVLRLSLGSRCRITGSRTTPSSSMTTSRRAGLCRCQPARWPAPRRWRRVLRWRPWPACSRRQGARPSGHLFSTTHLAQQPARFPRRPLRAHLAHLPGPCPRRRRRQTEQVAGPPRLALCSRVRPVPRSQPRGPRRRSHPAHTRQGARWGPRNQRSQCSPLSLTRMAMATAIRRPPRGMAGCTSSIGQLRTVVQRPQPRCASAGNAKTPSTASSATASGSHSAPRVAQVVALAAAWPRCTARGQGSTRRCR